MRTNEKKQQIINEYHCYDNHSESCDSDCDNCKDAIKKDIDELERFIRADADRIIEALEKQIPKVPCYSGDGYYNGEIVIDTWECPCCGKQYEVDYEDYKYCPNCGQCIDHSTLTEDD